MSNVFTDNKNLHPTGEAIDAVFSQPRLDTVGVPLSANHRYQVLLEILSDEKILLFDYCSAKSLVSLRRTCTAVKTQVDAYIAQKFNVDRILTRYFANPKAFRFLQGWTGTLISGSSALQFFDRSFYPLSELDLYVSKGWGPEVGHFLLQEGYSFVPGQHQHPTFDSALTEPRVQSNAALYGNFKGISAVFTFEKTGRGGIRKVQVMLAARTPIEVILRFHSSMSNNSNLQRLSMLTFANF